ncbi:hypothetical protein MKW92_025862 [Papaver armeniacum]|nr:hypothetical protein MKW92_025862 [Papaver armeniacum]
MARSISVSIMLYVITWPSTSYAYPILRRNVCANCHLANKPVDIEVPQAILPDLFLLMVKGGLNVGAVLLILPEGFELAPSDRISPK